MRVAFFGGSFDPPHLGHLHIALTAVKRLQLDQVLIAPVGRQPLKNHDPAPFADRLAMLALLTAQHPNLIASPIDAPQLENRPNYTADTLSRLRRQLPPAAELFILAGADSFLTLPYWHRSQTLLQPTASGGLLDAWILAARPGFPLASLAGALPPGYTPGPQTQSPANVLTQQILDPEGAPAAPLYLLADLDDPSTATEIRHALAAGTPPPHLPPAISDYICEHRLYTPHNSV